MFPFPENLYAQWRSQRSRASALREDESSPPENLLQAVWQHQRLLRDQLSTLDGQPVRILHPGFLSREGGPDFRGAVVQFGDAPSVAGDVEVDVAVGGWRAHGHDRNSNFKNVILHVIWDGSPSARSARMNAGNQRAELVLGAPPAVAIRGKLDAPLAELDRWLNSEERAISLATTRTTCSMPWWTKIIRRPCLNWSGSSQPRMPVVNI